MYVGYHVVNDTDPVESLKSVPIVKKNENMFSMKAPDPNPKALGYCIIETEDLFSGSVYDYEKKKMSPKMSPIKCSDCNQYIYKTGDQCSSYMYDTSYNELSPNIDDSSKVTVFCDPSHPERSKNCIQPHGVCTLDLNASKTCNF
jgi:hypothetical protein